MKTSYCDLTFLVDPLSDVNTNITTQTMWTDTLGTVNWKQLREFIPLTVYTRGLGNT